MTLAKNKKLSEYGKKGALTRWNNYNKKIIDNLKVKNKPHHLLLKAKLCGFLAGDGTVKMRRENKNVTIINYEVNFFPDHISLVIPYIQAFEELYCKKPSIKMDGKLYRIRTKCKIAYLDLSKIGKFGLYNWEVPLNFLKNDKLKIEWLKAFFDSEGHVSNRDIRLQSVNEKGLQQIKQLLLDIGIESRMYKYERKNKHWNTNYILSIIKKNHRKMYLNKIGFNHEIKLSKLKQIFPDATVA